MASDTMRSRLVAAAFDVFAEKGYEHTTVDEIALRAGVGRTTFFRTFRTKDEVAFPDHDRMIATTKQRLADSPPGSALRVAQDATVLLLRQYTDDEELARSRYLLTSRVPALRDREVAAIARYQRMLYEHLRAHGVGGNPLRAELLAAAWVTAHNHVLRRWLRGRTATPEDDLRGALDDVLGRLAGPSDRDGPGTSVAVFRTDHPIEAILPALQELLR